MKFGLSKRDLVVALMSVAIGLGAYGAVNLYQKASVVMDLSSKVNVLVAERNQYQPIMSALYTQYAKQQAARQPQPAAARPQQEPPHTHGQTPGQSSEAGN